MIEYWANAICLILATLFLMAIPGIFIWLAFADMVAKVSKPAGDAGNEQQAQPDRQAAGS